MKYEEHGFRARTRKRFAVIGDPSVGKTTFARQVSKILEIPHVELDTLKRRARKKNGNKILSIIFRELAANELNSESWVTCGNYSDHRHVIWANANVIVWLDYSLPHILSRLVLRAINRSVLKRGSSSYNKEHHRRLLNLKREFRLFLSVLKHYRRQKIFQKIFKEPEFKNTTIVRLTSQKTANEWLLKLFAQQSYRRGGSVRKWTSTEPGHS